MATSQSSNAGLSSEQFDNMLGTLKRKLAKILTLTGEKVLEVLLTYADELACCSKLQLQVVKKQLSDVGIGAHMSEYINKAARVGKKEMAPVVARMAGISCATYDRLTSDDREKLAADKPLPLKTRADIVMKRPSEMTEDEHHRLVRHFPKPKVMPPEQQHAPRPRPKPAYYALTDWVLDGATIVCTFELGSSLFKGRISLDKLREMLAATSRSARTT